MLVLDEVVVGLCVVLVVGASLVLVVGASLVSVVGGLVGSWQRMAWLIPLPSVREYD